MDAGDLAVFAAVARAGGITKAAQTLNTVQSNVTQRIRLLEAELGVPLFHRHSRGVTLTSAGAQLLPYAERIGRLIGEAKLAAANGPVPRGRIAIGALETATAVRLPPILAAYAASFPEVDIEIATGTSAELMDAVLAHRLEAAFVAGPVDHPQLVAHPLLEEELVVVTAPWVAGLDGLAAPGASGKVKIVVFRAGCTYRVRLEALLAARGVVGVRRLEFGTLDGIIGCVGAGVGVTLLPRAVVARAGAEGRVALHALPPDEARVETVLVRRRDAFVSTALMRFIEMAREHLAAGDTGRRTAARARLIAPRPAGRPAKATATPNPRAMAMAGTPRLKRSV
jgi:DNA-binding transcriptional LysR family regulator